MNSEENKFNDTSIAKADEVKTAIEKASSMDGKDLRDEILALIPEENQQKAMLVMASYEEKYSGPLPHPKHLEAYEHIQPGLADRIVKMAEAQQEHRFSLEKKAIGEQMNSNKRGQYFGFILALVLVLVSVIVMTTINSIIGIVMIAIVVITIFALYKNGKVSIAADLRNKKVSGEAQTKDSPGK